MSLRAVNSLQARILKKKGSCAEAALAQGPEPGRGSAAQGVTCTEIRTYAARSPRAMTCPAPGPPQTRGALHGLLGGLGGALRGAAASAAALLRTVTAGGGGGRAAGAAALPAPAPAPPTARAADPARAARAADCPGAPAVAAAAAAPAGGAGAGPAAAAAAGASASGAGAAAAGGEGGQERREPVRMRAPLALSAVQDSTVGELQELGARPWRAQRAPPQMAAPPDCPLELDHHCIAVLGARLRADALLIGCAGRLRGAVSGLLSNVSAPALQALRHV